MNNSDRNIPVAYRKAVRIRDKNKCRKCGAKKGLEFHHIIPFSESLYSKPSLKEFIHHPGNIVMLCHICHKDAPDDSVELYKWLMVYPDMPSSFSKTLSFIQMGLPALLMKRDYNLSLENNEWKVLLADFEVFLRDLWNVMIEAIDDGEDWKTFIDFLRKYMPGEERLDKLRNKFPITGNKGKKEGSS